MVTPENREKLLAVLKDANDVFKVCAKKTKILSTLSWDVKVMDAFFKSGESKIPKPVYVLDEKKLNELLTQLVALEPKLLGDHPVLQWLLRTQKSFLNAIRLLLEIEKKPFYEISTYLYGNSQTHPFNGSLTNLGLARAISARLSEFGTAEFEGFAPPISSEQFAAMIEKKINKRDPLIPVRVELSDDITSKIVAGQNRVRIRKSANFSRQDLMALWNHEIESHCLTAHNGTRQKNCDFMSSGGPRTTLTQEGLAVFHEIYGHTMSQSRFMTLCNRIEAVKKAEDGADFIELYRWYKERSENELEAFYNTQRIFRGGNLKGGGPFTKDCVYLTGLFGVYNFLRIAVKNKNRLLVESLVCGRIALEDVGTIAWMRTHGLIEPPYYLPVWIENWEALLSFFSLKAVLDSIDLNLFQNYFDQVHNMEVWDLSV